MRAVIASLLALVACRGSQPAAVDRGEHAGSSAHGSGTTGTNAPDAGASNRGATDGGAIDTVAPVPMPSDATVSMLVREAGGEPVLLVERDGAIVATTPSGKLAHVIAKPRVRRAFYDVRAWTIWFLRDGRLVAIDLSRTTMAEVVVAESMPDIDFIVDPRSRLENEDCPRGCVAIRTSATPALAVIEPSSEERVPQAERDAAARARTIDPPAFTDTGRTLFAAWARQPLVLARVTASPDVALSDTTWSMPPSASRRSTCRYDECGRAFAIDGIARSLMVVGSKCDCALDSEQRVRPGQHVDGCWGVCVWFDKQRAQYASLRAPGRWGADVAGEPACHPQFDAGGTSYVIGEPVSPGALAVCTANRCRSERGRFLGWLEPGFSTNNLNEDSSTCPH